MELSQLVTSLETSNRLKELGVKQESLFYHVVIKDSQNPNFKLEPIQNVIVFGKDNAEGYKYSYEEVSYYSSFTSSELGEMLPLFEVRKKGPDYYRSYSKLVANENDYFMSDEENMAESMGKLYIHLKENNLI